MSNEIFICKICGKEYKNLQSLSKHLSDKHKEITKKDYYDKYMKKENEGKCKYCNKNTRFINLSEGYSNTCEEHKFEFHNDPEWVDKVQKTMMDRYGFICNLNSQDNKEKANKAAHTKEAIKKHHKTMNDRYGGETTLQSSVLLNKVKETCIEKYNDENYIWKWTKERIIKSNQTKKEKYGNEHWVNPSKISVSLLNRTKEEKEKTYNHIKNTLEILYGGVANQSEIIKQKHHKTMKEKYGVEHALQSKELRDRARKKYTYDGKNFDSSWEIAYYIYLTEHHIRFEYHPIDFDYYYPGDNKIHKYEVDFKLFDNTYIEIKNPKLLDYMVNNKETKEYYKYNCMIEHKVRIITNCDKYINYVKIKYGSNFLESCKND